MSQNLSLEQTKTALCKNKWLIKRYEQNDKIIPVQGEYKGLKMVFNSDGTIYTVLASQDEANSAKNLGKWSITNSKIILDISNNGTKTIYNYKLEDFGGLKLYLSQDDASNASTIVYEQSGLNKNEIENNNPFLQDNQLTPETATKVNEILKEYESAKKSLNTEEIKQKSIKQLNELVKEAEGNIKYWSKNTKQKIVQASVIQTNKGVKIETVISEEDEPLTTYTYEFNPKDIDEMEIKELPDESPVGHLSFSLINDCSFNTSYDKKAGLKKSYKDLANLNYLKVDEESINKIKELFEELKMAYEIEDEKNALTELTDLIEYRKFWFSVDGNSKTYSFNRVDVSNCNLRISYNLESITTDKDAKQDYITEIPLEEIKEMRLEKSKSKPNCIMLEASGSGFTTYYLKGDTYVPANSVSQIPLLTYPFS